MSTEVLSLSHAAAPARLLDRHAVRLGLAFAAAAVAIASDMLLPRAIEQKEVDLPYFTLALALSAAVYAAFVIGGRWQPGWRKAALYRAPFYGGVVLALAAANLLTAKLAVLPVLYFPAPARILAVIVEDFAYLMTCAAYSYRLLLLGWFFGALAGIGCGILLGFSRTAAYWLAPFIRGIGPIPSTAWIPLVLVAFPTVVSGSVFLIALSVWFPTTVLTSSGIANIRNSYFEVGSTLGASKFYQIVHIGIPAALPNVFLGLFNGTCASFITLVTAEMLGAKYGLGWYINWQKEMMAYPNVYAGLLLIAVSFYLLMTGLFRFRDHVLSWQKGVIKW